MASKNQGGVNIHDVSRNVNIGGDVIGGNKTTSVLLEDNKEEKSGCVLAIEKGVIFVFTLMIGGVVMGVFGALIIGTILSVVTGSDNSGGNYMIGAVVGVILALGMAIVNATSVKHTK
jgi:hypothetical protein